MWTWGHVYTKFWHLPEPYLNQGGGGQIMLTLYQCPHQVLKGTGAPETDYMDRALEARAEVQKHFVGFLVQMKSLEFAFKIN